MLPKFNFTLILLLGYSQFISGQEDGLKKITNLVGDKFHDCYLKNKTKFDGCVIQFWNEIVNLMKTGDEKLNISKGEPMIIDRLQYNQKGAAVDLTGVLTNFTLFGMSNSVCTYAKVDTKSQTTSYNMTTPFLNITSDINLDGTIMLLPIKGHGKMAVNASGIRTLGKYEVVQEGTGVRITDINIDLQVKEISAKFIQADNDPIWDAINKLISDNAHALFDDMKPTVNKVITDRLMEYTADTFKKMPAAAFIA